jgi:branched-chain amino acid transport system ATP-binding protein
MLRIENLQVAYGGIVAVRGVNLQVNEGELVGLIGANGAGKTSLLMAVAGVVRPRQGQIHFRGENVTRWPPERVIRRGIATVPENRDIFPDLTVEENLRLGAYVRRNRREYEQDRALMCEHFPVLGERLHQAAGFLSGGEQQQLAIARALMSHPELLMLDEPSLGLAPALVDKVFELVQSLRQEGRTVLLVEQNVRQTLRIADRVYMLDLGQVKASGAPADLAASLNIADLYFGQTSQIDQADPMQAPSP